MYIYISIKFKILHYLFQISCAHTKDQLIARIHFMMNCFIHHSDSPYIVHKNQKQQQQQQLGAQCIPLHQQSRIRKVQKWTATRDKKVESKNHRTLLVIQIVIYVYDLHVKLHKTSRISRVWKSTAHALRGEKIERKNHKTLLASNNLDSE